MFSDRSSCGRGRGIAPTPRCEEIVAGIGRLFDQLAELAEPTAFDPSAAANELTISCNHYERSVILPGRHPPAAQRGAQSEAARHPGAHGGASAICRRGNATCFPCRRSPPNSTACSGAA